MRPVSRHYVNKRKSVKKFKKHVRRTKIVNVPGLARGGIRL